MEYWNIFMSFLQRMNHADTTYIFNKNSAYYKIGAVFVLSLCAIIERNARIEVLK